MQLAYHHALGAVDDELAAAEHDGHITQIDLFLDGLLACKPQVNLEGTAVGQAKLAALVRAEAGFTQLVADELQNGCLVVALDREDFAQHAFQAHRLALVEGDAILKETLVATQLNIGERGHFIDAVHPVRALVVGVYGHWLARRVAVAAEVEDFLGIQNTVGRDRHVVESSSQVSWPLLGGAVSGCVAIGLA